MDKQPKNNSCRRTAQEELPQMNCLRRISADKQSEKKSLRQTAREEV